MLLAAAVAAQPQSDEPNAVLLVARPSLADPNFRRTVVLVTQAADASTIGVILNRPSPRRHEKTGDPVYSGGPVMRDVLVAVFRSAAMPEASAFPVLKGVYITMHPHNVEKLLEQRREQAPHYRLYAGFSGWSPGQLEAELKGDNWYVLPASEELLFRADTAGLWEELVKKGRGRVAMLGASGILVP